MRDPLAAITRLFRFHMDNNNNNNNNGLKNGYRRGRLRSVDEIGRRARAKVENTRLRSML